MLQPDIILLHAPHVYDFRRIPQLYGPVSDLVPSTPVFEMYPMGFTSLAEYLEKAGFRVRIINLAWRMMRDARFDAEKFINKLEAPLFGLDLHWVVHAHGALEVAKIVRQYHAQSKIIFGGFSASYYWKELINYPQVDYVMRGDSTEEPMRQLLKNLKSRRLSSVPNLVWKDSAGKIHENPFTHIPQDISDVMQDHYGGIIRSVLRYRDLTSIIPSKGWLKQPVTAVFTSRGCTQNCIFCGGSQEAMRCAVNRQKVAFRTTEDIYKDIQQISGFSHGQISILGDIRQAGEEKAVKLLSILHQKPVKNPLMFEMFYPAGPNLVAEIAQAAPGFSLNISPHSHDSEVRHAIGLDYSNADMESMLESAIRSGAGRLEVFFMIGLPKQTRASVLESINYCEYLLRKFDGDRRLFLFIGPLAPFLDPASLAFEHPRRYGYKLLFRSLEEHRLALEQPSWKYILNYQTDWLSRQDIMSVTYEAIARLMRIKAKYGQISTALAEAQVERIEQAIHLERRIDAIMRSGHPDELAQLKPEMDKINGFRGVQQRQMDLPLGLFRLRYLNSLWGLLLEQLKQKPRG
jgi:B12-binding domain/radical SAM domain protein